MLLCLSSAPGGYITRPLANISAFAGCISVLLPDYCRASKLNASVSYIARCSKGSKNSEPSGWVKYIFQFNEIFGTIRAIPFSILTFIHCYWHLLQHPIFQETKFSDMLLPSKASVTRRKYFCKFIILHQVKLYLKSREGQSGNLTKCVLKSFLIKMNTRQWQKPVITTKKPVSASHIP